MYKNKNIEKSEDTTSSQDNIKKQTVKEILIDFLSFITIHVIFSIFCGLRDPAWPVPTVIFRVGIIDDYAWALAGRETSRVLLQARKEDELPLQGIL